MRIRERMIFWQQIPEMNVWYKSLEKKCVYVLIVRKMVFMTEWKKSDYDDDNDKEDDMVLVLDDGKEKRKAIATLYLKKRTRQQRASMSIRNKGVFFLFFWFVFF